MRYGILFLILGACCVVLGVASGTVLLLPLLWSGLVFGVVGVAYLVDRPRFFGKRRDGTIALSSRILLFPFFAFSWALWHLERLARSEASGSEVAKGLWVARRPARGEALPAGIALVVDLTAEFSRAAAIGAIDYACLPTLDALAPAEAELRALVARAVAMKGGVYVHCASGHGRSATFAAAVLVVRGVAAKAGRTPSRSSARSGRAFTSIASSGRWWTGSRGPPFPLLNSYCSSPHRRSSRRRR